ncbi:MAG TPA: M20/M25/M40 family metallo-hydrolase [Mycobacteriales bacterium]|nr:M20/M25/M40 family metallo-hydrolase [Mycobacteriales bacterium]
MGSDNSPQDEVVDLCRDLIRIDSTNDGTGRGPGERAAAEWVAEKLAEVGVETQLVESAPNRTRVVARIPGTDRNRAPLLVHGHLDVVPAEPKEWTYDPFAGEIADGCLWGRGAIDMKDMDAMVLAVVRHRMRTQRPPARDIVLAFLADEEAGGVFGAQWLVEHHPQLFADCTEGISEVGGFSLTVNDDLRLYLIETAQKGMAWLRLTAAGTAGHGSMINDDNAVTRLCEAVARLGAHEFPVHVTPTVRTFLSELGDAFGVELDADDIPTTLATLGPLARIIGATLRNTANPTMLDAGYKHNVIPGTAHAMVDGRFLPGFEDAWERELDEVLGAGITREYVHYDIGLETAFEGALVEAMSASLLAEDPGARAVPYMLSGGTDAKSFDRLGIRGFGFSPLRLPPGLDFAGMFHGVDERVPLESLRFGTRVLDRFFDAC